MSRAHLDKDPAAVSGMFDGVAKNYDLTNDVLTFGLDRHWRRETVKAIDALPGERVLDLAAGTGTSSEPLADAGVDVVPCDFSPGMVEVGRRRRPDLPFVVGDATDLPFSDGEFDAVTISFGLRNVVDTDKALSEMLRVTKPGGRLVICEFSTPPNALWRAGYRFYNTNVLPLVARAVSSNTDAYDYLNESIAAWPDQRALARKIAAAGWIKVGYRNLFGGVVALHRASRPTA
ncbi:demethylmenaquinone methyltransferase [Pseudactinotalea suaedae]|uniref:demethylmenaquinone methyltransferase n=1 Tax=Pseudactinotalea suaedae TaxID=1524924 RepID=UPI0012E2D4A7|nr:demethylmenaquinone methyltransferase [Pseudactinotalea suaedae]